MRRERPEILKNHLSLRGFYLTKPTIKVNNQKRRPKPPDAPLQTVLLDFFD
jgi:hypothetical protein